MLIQKFLVEKVGRTGVPRKNQGHRDYSLNTKEAV